MTKHRRGKEKFDKNQSSKKSRPKNSLPAASDKEASEEIEEFIFGKHAVLSHLQSEKQINKVFLQKGVEDNFKGSIMNLIRQQSLVYQSVPKSKLDDLTDGANHQGIVLAIPPYEYAELEDAFQLAESRKEHPFLIILDGIEDPHNLGSILRTAEATGVHGVIIPKRRAVGLTGVVAKTSTGAIEHVPVIRVTNLSQTIVQLKERGVWVFATDMAGEDMRQWNSQGSLAIVIGNEGQGVSELVAKSADGTVTIPMVGQVQSLNASVAAGVLMYEVARHRIAMPD